MTESQAALAPAVVLRRSYNASPERVFAAWSTPEIAAKFLGPGDVVAKNITMDVRPGGAFRLTMLKPDGEQLPAFGIYREVLRPERLVMTWTWEEDDPADQHETLLTLEFHERNGGTDFVLRHEQLASVESRDRHEEGWTLIVDQLPAAL